MKFLIKIVLIVLCSGITLIAKDIATVTGLNGKAFVERDGVKIEVTTGSSLQEKDTIVTNERAKVQIIFEDETIVTVGKNSEFSINEYLFEENQEPVAKFGMIKGAMRTITGKIGEIAPDKFSVIAKTATIGIRGTNFSVLVGEDDSVQVYCTHGAISATISGVEHIVRQGFFITISPDGKVIIKEFTSEDLKEMKEKNFGKSEPKKGEGYEDSDAAASSDGQLDTTREDDMNLVIKDITDSSTDGIQTTEDLTSLLESYSMSDALYTGTFTRTVFSGGDWQGAAGTATLAIDFGSDTTSLTLNNGTDDFIINGTSTFSGTGLSLTNATDNVSATFQAPTGNSATGTYSGYVGGAGNDEGTFDVSTQQELY